MSHGLPQGPVGVSAIEVKVRPPRLLRYEWMIVSALVVAGLALGFAGARGSSWGRLNDSLELLYPHFPGAADAGTPWTMMVARFLLPLLALYATVRFVVSFYSQRVRLMRLRRLRGHTVVFGLTDAGLRAALTSARDGGRVVAVDSDGLGRSVELALDAGVIVVVADATRPAVQDATAASRATRLVCALPRDADNLRLATDADAANHAQAVFAQIEDPDLAELAAASGVECFDLNDIWARNLLEAGPLARPGQAATPHIVIVGDSALAQALIVNAARSWHFFVRELGSGDRLTITVVAAGADSLSTGLQTRYPALSRTSALATVELTTSRTIELPALLERLRPDAAYLCTGDDAFNAGIAQRITHDVGVRQPLDVIAAIREPDRPTVDGSGAASAHFTEIGPEHSVDGFRLERFGAHEQLARALHGIYVNAARSDAGGARTAVAPFDELAPEDQQRNRDQAADITEQLAATFWRTAPLGDWDELAALPDDDVEVMAHLEHLRWMATRVRGGWQRGAERDEGRKLHPDITRWDELSEPSREINRAFVRARPALLGRTGRTLERDPVRDAIAVAVHRQYRARMHDEGLEVPDWEALSNPERAPSMALVASLPSTLLSVGRKIVAHRTPADTLTPDAVEALARAAHSTWASQRTRDGWTFGPERDDQTRSHPDLVPWDELSESRREIDRVLVQAIPTLLDRAGWGVERVDLGGGATAAGQPSAPERRTVNV